jgi:acyl carrier protein
MNDVYERLVAVLGSGFGLRADEVQPEVTFASLEFDSLALVELALAAQQEFAVSIGEGELGPDHTVKEAVELIQLKGAGTS